MGLAVSTLYITEYSKMAWAGLSSPQALPAPMTPPVAEQALAIGGASVQSAAFQPATTFIQVATDAACSLAFGNGPVAVTTAHRLGAGEVRFYGVGTGQQLAVIANT